MKLDAPQLDTQWRSALATTIGPLVADPDAGPLAGPERARLERWREASWRELEARAGELAERDPAGWYELLAFEGWCSASRAPRLPPVLLDLFYRVKPVVPRQAQLAMRRMLVRRQGGARFPAWPFESAGHELLQIAIADALLDCGRRAVRFPWFWPDGLDAAVTLTHDVESAQGLAFAPVVAGWEEERGLRSSFNVVGDWYPVDPERLCEISQRGHEIGAHGIRHDRSLFASRASFEEQLPLLRDFAERVGAVGFRSPATHRVVEWLGELPFSYDCTMPHSDPYEPIPGGTATTWPFFHGEVVELPYTAPQDHTLYNLLDHRDSTLWCEQLDRVLARHGLFQTITHPDAGYLGRPEVGRAYRDLLDAIAAREDIWAALPRDVAAWWRSRRDGFSPQDDGVAGWTGSTILLAPAAKWTELEETSELEHALEPAAVSAR